MRVHDAMGHVAALIDRRDVTRDAHIADDEQQALNFILNDYLFMRQRAQALQLLNLLVEHRGDADATQDRPAIPSAYSEMAPATGVAP